jgi:HEAT repeat protein
MIALEMQQKALDTLALMSMAVQNMRLYPPSGAMAFVAVDRLNQTLAGMFAQGAKLIFTVSGKNVLLCGDPLSPTARQRRQHEALLERLLRLGIRSITLEKGLDRTELASFLEIIDRNPEHVRSEGGLPQLLAERNLLHILIDQKVHVARNGNRRTPAGSESVDDPVVRDVMQAFPELRGDLERVREMVREPERLCDAFRAAVEQDPAQHGIETDIDRSERVTRMIRALDRATAGMNPEGQEGICRRIGTSISGMDPEAVSRVLSGDIEGLFGGVLMQHIINGMDDAKFAEINERLLSRGSQGAAADQGAGTVTGPSKTAGARGVMDPNWSIAPFLNGAEDAFPDRLPVTFLPELAARLADDDENALWAIIRRLSGSLLDPREDVRAGAASALAGIMDGLPGDLQEEVVEGIADGLVAWVRFETESTPAYERICLALKNHVTYLIHRGRYDTAVPVLDVFSRIHAGVLEKNVMVQRVAAEVIRDLASDRLTGLLFAEFHGGRDGKRTASGRMLARLGEVPLNRLMDMLRDQGESNKRVRILQVLGEVGPMVIPLIRERIREGGSWCCLRNLTYLLGRVGSEKDLGELRPLLFHEDLRVRREALRSIQRIGGDERGPLLLSVLTEASDPARINIVEMLGRLKWADAVVPLLDLLKDRPFIASSSRADLEEGICVALGRIGAPGAIRTLSNIRDSKSFLGVQPYHEKVIYAAARALASIRSRGGMTGPQSETIPL